ncbi:MAG TPA: excinuclease ABC subunit UvrC [Thiobacillaceae bacterium]|nr:excinuclease ABC subunit UvrC [Thiobacillaceae bacterium]
MTFDPKTFISNLPSLPGVYRMLGADAAVLYVGKARDLKKRVASYFNKTGLSPRIRLMVEQIVAIETTVTRTEAEALLLENNLIKALAPRYNILFRDDKSYPYLLLSGHEYPRIAYYRGATDKKNRYFGPYPNAWAVKESINLLQRMFRLRTCEDTVFAHRSRPCLLYQIKRCTAPCVGHISRDDYGADVKSAMLFLDGKEDELTVELSRRMQAAATAQQYEIAAQYRDQIHNLSKMRQQQFVESGAATDADVVAATSRSGVGCVNLLMIRSGRHLGDRAYFPHNAGDSDSAEILHAFISQHYLEHPIPPVIVSGETLDADTLGVVLSQQAGRKVSLLTRPQGEKRVWLSMALKGAEVALAQQLAQRATQQNRLATLQEALDLPQLQRIECFDVSHTLGEATVASCVVYEDGAMKNSEYRRYNISGITPGDDYAAMRDALTRRYTKVQQGEGKRPDLLLIDGGLGQLNVAVEVMAELGLNDLDLIGVAKGEERKPGLEQLVYPGGNVVRLPSDSPALHLIQTIRDEAHRFAITGHRARRGKARTHSSLEDIPGIGPKKRKALLEHFGGLQGVRNAGVEELARVAGIQRELAERIYQALH